MKQMIRWVGLGVVLGALIVGLLAPGAQSALAEPDAIVLSSFTVKAKPGQKVKIKWTTGVENSVVGFNVLRARKANKPFKPLNTTLIPPKNPGGLTGASYGRKDLTVKAGKKYFYKVQVLKTSPPDEVSEIIEVTAKP